MTACSIITCTTSTTRGLYLNDAADAGPRRAAVQVIVRPKRESRQNKCGASFHCQLSYKFGTVITRTPGSFFGRPSHDIKCPFHQVEEQQRTLCGQEESVLEGIRVQIGSKEESRAICIWAAERFASVTSVSGFFN
jgi:hypothetical protein